MKDKMESEQHRKLQFKIRNMKDVDGLDRVEMDDADLTKI